MAVSGFVNKTYYPASQSLVICKPSSLPVREINMEKFVVSARKYRPQNFNSVVGQDHITTTLKNAIRNQQLAHAFLFCGPRGVGKTTCARILAKTINCLQPTPDGEACNVCNSCISFNDGTSLNIHELDAASNNSVDDIRSLVEQVRFAPQAGKYKVYIVDEVHMLSTSAFNAFLKTLEEPPSYAIFILATTEKHKILPTILSRCQIFDFRRITNDDTVQHLREIADKESIQAEKSALQVIAQKSEGCMRDSLSILDKIVSFTNGEVTYQNTLEHLNILDHDYYFQLLDAQLKEDMAGTMLLYDEINRKGFEGDLVLNGYAEFIRNLLVCQNPKAASLLDVVEGMKDKYLEVSSRVNAAYLISALNLLNEAEINYKMARNKRLHVEMTMIRLTFLQQAIDLTFDNETSSLVKKKRVSGPVAVKFHQIQSLQIKAGSTLENASKSQSHTESAKLYIQAGKEEKPLTPLPENNRGNAVRQQPGTEAESNTIGAETLVAEPVPIRKPKPNPEKRNFLDNLRDQHKVVKDNAHEVKSIPITPELLKEQWNCFVEVVRQKAKHSVVTVLSIAQLEVVNEQHFNVIVSTSLEQKFLEQEKLELLEHLKNCFRNQNVGFTIKIVELPKEEQAVSAPVSTRDKYLQLIEQYPMVKELKDRLKLDLDY